MKTSKFRNSRGNLITKGLFVDVEPGEFNLYRMYTDSCSKYPNIQDLYLSCTDPTEYEFASKYFESYDHWLQVRNGRFMRGYADIWKKDLEARLVSNAVKKIIELSTGDDAKALQAAKFIANKEYNNSKKRGRPSKAEVEGELKAQTKEQKEHDDDTARIFHLIKGVK